MMIIREMALGDYEAMYALWLGCEGIGLSASDSQEQIGLYLARNPGMSFVAEVDGRLVGTILGGHDGRRGTIHHAAVHPDFRHQGIGQQLVATCLAALRAAGVLKCHIFVHRTNEAAQAFWRAVGWHDRGDLHLMSVFLEGDV
jgi:ribosomal protein S18 acetylase RimI-like enzyme